jgi:subtilisin family serine protease
MKKNYLFEKFRLSTIFIVLFAVLNAQVNSKFDRTFKILYENKELIKSSKKNIQIPTSSDAQKISSKNTGELLYSCIIYTTEPDVLKKNGIQVQSVLPKFVTALITLDDLDKLAALEQVREVKYPQTLSVNNDIAVGQSGASLLQAGKFNNTVYKGKGVLVGIFDTGNYFKHPDFRDPTDQTKSRILKMWDQTLTPTGAEVSPSGFTYGVEYTKAQLDDELAGVTTGFVREADTHGHGTHVAGTAAGNGMALTSKKYTGMAPESDLIIVRGGVSSFSETNIINGLTYFNNVATALGKPIVVNMSIGGHFSAHDGTGPEEEAVDFFSNSGPGRVVAIAAGNDNGSNIHKQNIIAPGSTGTISITLGNNTSTGDIFGFLLYSNSSDDFSAVITAPGGETVTANVGEKKEQNVILNGIKVYADNLIDSSNNHRYLDFFLQRVSGSTSDVSGTWTIAITNNGISNIITNGWQYHAGTSIVASIIGGDSNYLIGSPGAAKTAITTASYSGTLSWYSNKTGTPGVYSYTDTSKRVDGLSTFSSYGPLTDGTQKPDIAAVGEIVVSALSSGVITTASSSNVDGTYYQVMSGTSMATPVVTGAIALMLQAKPTATYSEIKNALITNAQTDASTGVVPSYTWGYGKLDVYQALTSMMGNKKNKKTYINETYPYALSTNTNVNSFTTTRLGELFTPDMSGYLGGVYFNVGSIFTADSFTIEVRTNNSGVPGTLISSKSIDPSSISKYTWNYFDMSDLKISVTSGIEYFIVIYAGGTSPTMSLIRESIVGTDTTKRLRLSNDDGSTWSASSYIYRIRSVVYESSSSSLATSNVKLYEVSIYPNPTSDILKVKLLKNEKSKIEIYDLSGRLVKQMNANSDNIELNVSALDKGTYLINIVTPSDTISKKIIKK